MSGLPSEATVATTSQIGSFVPETGILGSSSILVHALAGDSVAAISPGG